MRFTDIFIKRPVMAASLSMLLFIFGLNSISSIDVRQFPKMTNTVITVTTPYPGADPALVEGAITQQLEQALAQVDRLDFMTSSSELGTSTITLNMLLDTNPEEALADALAQINSVTNDLPDAAYNPSITSSTSSTTALMYISFYSDTLNPSQITDYIERVVSPQLATVEGVSNITYQGGAPFALRIWPIPEKLGQYDISTQELVTILQENNFQSAIGEFNSYFTVLKSNINSQVIDVEGLKRLVIKSDNGDLVRLQDVAEVSLDGSNDDTRAIANGRQAVIIGINLSPTGNPLTVAQGLRSVYTAIKNGMPPSINSEIVYDSSIAIEDSIREVVTTLGEAAIIVIVVIMLFMASFRSVIIPIVTIPLSLIGVIALMQAVGFTLNLMTLLAMVLAIGLVVDDAIVVVENVDRHINNGSKPFKAAIEATREIAIPVISMTITLAAVYTPIALMGGITGALFKEFALTLAGSVVISGFIALTLSPMMCSKLMKEKGKASRFQRIVDGLLHKITSNYHTALLAVFNHRRIVLCFAFIVIVSLPVIFSFLPAQLAPDEDQGVVLVMGTAPSTANNDYIEANMALLADIIGKRPEASASLALIGIPTTTQGIGIGPLIPWSERELSQKEISNIVSKEAKDLPGINASAFQLPALPGSSAGLPVQFVITSPTDFESLYSVGSAILEKAKASPLFLFADVDLKYDSGTANLVINRDAAGAYGVTAQAIGNTLGSLMGGGYINRVNIDGRSYEVIPEAERRFRATPDQLSQFYVTAQDGSAIPMSSLVSHEVQTQPKSLPHYNQLNSITISAVPAPNVAISDAISFFETQAREALPRGFNYAFMGESRQFVEEGNALYVTLALALAVIFLVLASQFESLRDPLVIMLTVPMAISGALIALGWTHVSGLTSLNIYSQVGLITLVGLISKHGILMCEMAKNEQIEKGSSKTEAIIEAARIRLRPILMTVAAMIAGLIPLLYATGAGAVSRYNIGLVIVAGLSIGTLFTLFVLPVMYSYISAGHTKGENAMEDMP
ncbi:efflux RND transporter permease subunit [Pseudovibrio sp. SPO723]|uniref:efflux RND transporter permease subunit n=1 Tax=Nesiotobacter zosterae TaxID=392721 RepID=UPI0029C16D20|nr:efflux RND transporter permease subunit [Pseudovibrio sp. SPO723]MDX5594282.1 efflux RND transporter permease subunit [Pseudovibrio sp. SPO723]